MLTKIIFALFFILGTSCSNSLSQESPELQISHFGINLNIPEGWVLDKSIEYKDPAKGGIFFQLIRTSTVPGSPRVTGSITPLTPKALSLNQARENAQKSLQALKTQKGLTLESNSSKERTFVKQPAFELKHRYTLGTNKNQLSVSQIELITIHKGRAISIVAAGRTELFTPLQNEILEFLNSATYSVQEH